MNEFDFSEGHWDGPHDDPREADSTREAVAIDYYGEHAIAIGDETKDEWLVAEQGAHPLEKCI